MLFCLVALATFVSLPWIIDPQMGQAAAVAAGFGVLLGLARRTPPAVAETVDLSALGFLGACAANVLVTPWFDHWIVAVIFGVVMACLANFWLAFQMARAVWSLWLHGEGGDGGGGYDPGGPPPVPAPPTGPARGRVAQALRRRRA